MINDPSEDGYSKSNYFSGSFVLTGLIESAAFPYLGLQIGELTLDDKAEILFVDQAYGHLFLLFMHYQTSNFAFGFFNLCTWVAFVVSQLQLYLQSCMGLLSHMDHYQTMYFAMVRPSALSMFFFFFFFFSRKGKSIMHWLLLKLDF